MIVIRVIVVVRAQWRVLHIRIREHLLEPLDVLVDATHFTTALHVSAAVGAQARGGIANSNHYSAGDLGAPSTSPMMADPLAVVLSTSGTLFALTPGQPERAVREHRRTRRGKQRRSRSMMTAPVQARLFDRR